jgi:hypothetical protein
MRPKPGRLNLKTKRRGSGKSRFSKVAPILERTAIVVLVLVLAAGVWSLVRGNPSNHTKSATQASRADRVSSVKTSEPSPTSPTSAPTTTVPAPPPAAPVSDKGGQATYAVGRADFTVAVAAKDAPLWIQVRAGARGAQLFMGTLQPGETKPFPAKAGALFVRVGNVAHSVVTVDGGPMALPPKPAVPYNLLFQR